MILFGKKDTKTKQAQVIHLLLGSGLSLLSGILFTYIIGSLDSSQYLLEQMSIVLIELPFVVCYAVLVRKYDWLICCAYAFLGTAASFALIFPGNPVTPLVFLKISFMGIILGKYNWLSGSFLRRISAVAIPGIIIAFVFGLPIIINGVSPEIIEETKQEPPQDDRNALWQQYATLYKEYVKIDHYYEHLSTQATNDEISDDIAWLKRELTTTAEAVPFDPSQIDDGIKAAAFYKLVQEHIPYYERGSPHIIGAFKKIQGDDAVLCQPDGTVINPHGVWALLQAHAAAPKEGD